MSGRDIGLEILEGIRENKANMAGQIRLRTHTLKRPAPLRRIRARLKLSQCAFAGLMGVSLRTVQDWERGRRKPSGPAEASLRIADQHPEAFTQLVWAIVTVRMTLPGHHDWEGTCASRPFLLHAADVWPRRPRFLQMVGRCLPGGWFFVQSRRAECKSLPAHARARQDR
jgi:putative transcriptional regulator